MISPQASRWRYHAYQLIWHMVDWVFPPVCAGCDQTGERWCSACQTNSDVLTGNLCPICGLPQATAQVCAECANTPPPYRALRSWGKYGGPLRNAIVRLKYKSDMGMGEVLSKHLIKLYNDVKWEVDLVTAVPLSANRQKQRGYNQAGLLARPLAYAISKPYTPNILLRTRDTPSQVHLTAQQRRTNLLNAFSASAPIVHGKVVLVIDDVTTTGSTISACAQALSQAGAAEVYGITLARAMFSNDRND